VLYEFYLAQPASVLLPSFTVIVPQVICGGDEVTRGTRPTKFAVAVIVVWWKFCGVIIASTVML